MLFEPESTELAKRDTSSVLNPVILRVSRIRVLNMALSRTLSKIVGDVMAVGSPEMMMVRYMFFWFGPGVKSRDSRIDGIALAVVASPLLGMVDIYVPSKGLLPYLTKLSLAPDGRCIIL